MADHKIKPEVLQQFLLDLFDAVGIDPTEASIITEALIWANLIGRTPQGLVRLSAYIERFKRGLITSPCRPQFIQKTACVAILDGNDGFGHYLGQQGMLKAIEMADESGIGLVAVRQANHFGAAAYYVHLAAERGKLGLVASNSFPRVAPHGGVTPVLGTNPFAFGAPLRQGHSILVDLSTSAIAGSSIRQAISEQRDLPPGVVVDKEGYHITDSTLAQQGTILPFGGAKGFCLGLMVEILSGVITGAAISHEIASVFKNFERPSKNGYLFMAIDIATLMPVETYFDRMETLVGFIKAATPAERGGEILLPGETRWRLYEQQRIDGIKLDTPSLNTLANLAHQMSVPTPW